jgi:putative secretion ATPase (PEP-CTERM system associated)
MYEEHFGLTAKPFQLSPDAAFFFPSKEHQRALSFLEYGLDQADGFIVITGDVGTGKTTIVQTLLESLDKKELMVANLVTTQLKEDDLIQLVAVNFGLRIASNPNKAMLLRELEKLFVQQYQQNRRVLLIVDEAQNLPQRSVEELRMLSNFQLNGRPLVQIFLLGQAEFRATLLSEGFEQLRQRVIATYHLNPLDEDETRTYIEHRLNCANFQGRPAFTDSAFLEIFEASEGVPRRINNLCDRILLFAFLEEVEVIDAEVVTSVSRELGGEFWSGAPAAKGTEEKVEEVFTSPGQPLESMARSMFDKADLQQRLSVLERAIDGLGAGLKSDISDLSNEVAQLSLLVESTLHLVREGGQPYSSKDGSKDGSEESGELIFPYQQKGLTEIP